MRKESKWAAGAMTLMLTVMAVFGATVITQEKIYAADSVIGAQSTGSLTINKKEADGTTPLPGAEFSIYKVMKLEADIDTAGFYKKYEPTPEFAASLNGISPDALGNYDSTQLENLIQTLKLASEGMEPVSKGTTASPDGTLTFSDVELGYYLVVETKAPEGYIPGNPFLAAIPSTDTLQGKEWVYDVSVTPKNSKVGIDKKLAAPEVGSEQDGTVAQGDYVKYQVSSTIPTYPDSYYDQQVTFKISDKMSDGLAIQDGTDMSYPIIVMVDGVKVEPSETTYELTASNKTGEEADLIISFAKEYIKANGGKKVTATYYAQVTDQAVMGLNGNKNNAWLEYTNKPGASVETLPTEVKVYTFGINLLKFTKAGGTKVLQGAEFMLYSDAELHNEIVGGTTDINGNISFPKLDEGTYYLKETKSPSGYTLLTNAIKIEIIAEKEETTNVVTGSFLLKVDGKEIMASTGDYVTKFDTTTGISTIAIENHKGFTLPATGGKGIVLLLVIGMSGIAAISVMMIRKPKKGTE